MIDVHGVGYKAYVPLVILTQLPPEGEEVKLLVTTIVKEDSITLYGFADEGQQGLFDILLTVSGVGPKAALNILSVLPVEQVVRAISSEAFHELNRVPGVGTKTAQRIVLELREKITTLVWAEAARKTMAPEDRAVEDAIEGLVSWGGYNRSDAKSAVEEALKIVKDKRDVSSIMTAALKFLAKG